MRLASHPRLKSSSNEGIIKFGGNEAEIIINAQFLSQIIQTKISHQTFQNELKA
jgi:hypothetical protein